MVREWVDEVGRGVRVYLLGEEAGVGGDSEKKGEGRREVVMARL